MAILDAREMLRDFIEDKGLDNLPIGIFRARHYGPELDCDSIESYFSTYGIDILSVEIVKFDGKADFVYVLQR